MMGTTVLPLIALFVSCFILFSGNGLINVLLPVRMTVEGMDTGTTGMVLSLYFVGMLMGALLSRLLIHRTGHIRTFSGCVALGAISILVCGLYTHPLLWGAMRVVLGFCNACAFTAIESWLSDASSRNTRGKVLALYNAVALGGLFGGQFLLNLATVSGPVLFTLAGILLCFSVIPILLSRLSGPPVTTVEPMSLLRLYRHSSLGVVCCLVSGVLYGALFGLLPVFAADRGITGIQLSLYVGAAILGAFMLQYPVGYLSDRFDRRTVLFYLLLVSASAALATPWLAGGPGAAFFVTTALCSGIISCCYPLSIAETFDRLRQREMVAAMGSMILAFSLGGMLGPYSISLLMQEFGNDTLFHALAAIQLLLALYVMNRVRAVKALPVADQEHFVMHEGLATPAVELDPRAGYVAPEPPPSAEARMARALADTDAAAAVKMTRAMALSDPQQGVEMTEAVAAAPGIDALRLYEVMQEVMPQQLLETTLAVIKAKPDLAYELVKQLARRHPDQVVPVAARIGHDFPELRVEMARAAVEAAPQSASSIAAYYAHELAEQRQSLRPADRELDTSEADAVQIVSQLAEAVPEQAVDVALEVVEQMPDTASELLDAISSGDHPREGEWVEPINPDFS